MAISNRSNEANHRFSLDASLDGRTVLITGGGGGMGGAMADAFLQQGCVVIAAQRNEMATSHERLHFISMGCLRKWRARAVLMPVGKPTRRESSVTRPPA